MKRQKNSFSKKGLVGLKRVGVGVERHWEYKGKKYKTLRELLMTIRVQENKKD